MTTHNMGKIIFDVAHDIGMTTIMEDQFEELIRIAMRTYTDYNSIVRGDAVKSAAVAIGQLRDGLKMAAWKLAETNCASVPVDIVDKKLMQYFDGDERNILTEASNRLLREEQNNWRLNGSVKDTRHPSEYGELCRESYKIAKKPPLFSHKNG